MLMVQLTLLEVHQKMRVINKITLIFYAKSVNWGELGGRISRFGGFSA